MVHSGGAYRDKINQYSEETADRLSRPLHGLPVLIKGNIGTQDELQTTGQYFSFPIWLIF